MERFCDDEKTNQLLIDCGRETASNLLISAVEGANEEQMNNQIFVCRRAAIHVLATEMFNRKQRHAEDPGRYLIELAQEIREEMEFLENSGMTFVGSQGGH